MTTNADWPDGTRQPRRRLARRLARHSQSVASPVRWNVVVFAFCSRVSHSSAYVVVVRAASSTSSGLATLSATIPELGRLSCYRAALERERDGERLVDDARPIPAPVRREMRRRRTQ